MKKLTFFIGILSFVLLSGTASADGLYLGGSAGYTFPLDSDVTDSNIPGTVLEYKVDSDFAFSGFVGYKYQLVRFEGEVAYQKNELDKAGVKGLQTDVSGETSSLAFLFNLYLDLLKPEISRFIPYLSAGMGYARVEFEDVTIPGAGIPPVNDDDNVLAFQLGGGFGYYITDHAIIDFKYRYFITEDLKFETTTAEFSSHNLYVGFRFQF